MFERFSKGSRNGPEPRAPIVRMPAPAIRALEPRFVFDGAAAASAAQTQSDAEKPADTSHAEAADKSSAAPVAAGPHAETASANGRHEIVVIDKSVADWQTLIAGIPSSAEVILIDAGTDGFDRLADALKGRSDIDAIHILSHGSAGDLHLGSAELTAQSIQGRYAADLAIIGNALTATGDILIYGCDFAAGEAGARAAQLLAQATGADVAASDDATGDTALGGDWDLEVHDGSIETGIIVSDAAQHAWHHLLAAATIHVSGDPVVKDGSGNTISTTRASNGVNYLDVNSNVVGATAFWATAGTVDGVNVSLRATVVSTGETDDAVSFATSSGNGGDASVLIRSTTAMTGTTNKAASVTIRWDLVRADNPSVAVAADIDFQIGDIDGIGGQPNTRESVTPSQFGLTSYTLATTTDLTVDSSNDRIRVSGTQDETASPPDSVSIVRFDWTNVSSWQVTYDLAANSQTGQAAFQHDGDRGLTFNAGTPKSVPKVDLDTNDSSGATGYDYKTTYTEKGSAVAVSDTDPLVSNTAATVSSATIVLTNAQAGDRLNTGTLPGGLTATTTTGSGTITVTISGDADPTTYQNAIRAITFDSTNNDPSTADRIIKTHVTSDGVQGTSSTTTVTFVAVDDPPVNTVPTARTINEDTSLVFSSANGTAITVSDVDAEGGNLTTTLSVLHGVISLGSTTGLASLSGNGTGTVTLTGTITAINAALNGTTYTPAADFNGNDTLTVTTNDNGNTGTGGAKSDTDTVSITVTPVNDAPVLDLDGSAAGTGYATSYTEGGTGVAIVNGNVAVSDVDNTTMASAKAVITNGSIGDALSISGTLPTGITASFDPATYTLTLTGSATKADYQTALQQIRYASTSQDPSTVTRSIAVTVNDGALDSNTAAATITFTAVNDAPVNTVPGGQIVAEDSALVFSTANGNRISVSDPDAGSGSLTTTISVLHGNVTLGSTSGLSSFSGNGTGTVTLTGSISAINAALDGASYQGAQDYNGADTLTVTTNDNGNTGTGGAKSDTDTVSITVTPVNDAPALDLDGSAAGTGYATSYTEGGTGVAIVNGNVTVSDVDNTTMASAKAVITNGSTGDALSISGTLPTGITASFDPSTYTLTLTGSATKADYQTALQQIRYASTSQDPSTVTRTIQVSVNDGALDSNTAVASVTFTAVNDAPVNTVPGGQIVAEDSALVFSTANGNRISVSDPDAGSGSLTTTISVLHGNVTLGSTSGLSSFSGNGTGTVTLTGSISAINAALDGARYQGTQDYNGADTLTVTTNDNGNTGTGGAKSDTDTVSITVTPVNDAPVLDLDASAPGTGYATSYTEGGTGVAIVNTNVLVSDVDNTTMASAKAIITNGSTGDALSISGTLPTGITASFDPSTYTLTLTGSATKADYQTALQQIRYASTSQDPSTVTRTIQVSVNDGALDSNTAVASVTFTAVNDAPVNTVPGGQIVAEDTALVFSTANGNRISVSDPDAGGSDVTTTVGVQHGSLTLGSTAGLTSVTGNGTGTVVLKGSLNAINAALDGLRYRGSADYNGPDTLTITTNDNGNTGAGGAKSDTDTVSITVTPVNDAPVLDLDGSAAGTGYATSYTEGGAGIAIVNTNVAVSDVDNTTMASAKGVITNGSAGDALSISGTLPTGITASFDPSTYTLTLTGSATKADYQTALQQIRYASTSQDPSTVTRTIQVSVNDGALDSNTAVASVTFTAVNDAPVNTVPGGQTVAEDTDLVFSTANANQISIADPDAGGSDVTTTVGVQHGSLTLGSTTGLTSVTGDGTGTVVLKGSISAINAALDGLRYRGSADYNGPDTLTVTTNDNGNTGSGGAKSDTDMVSITVTPVNDAPVNGLPSAQAVDEDTNLVFSIGNGNAITVSDVDAGGGSLTTTLSVQHGTLTLGGTNNVTVSGNGSDTVTLTGTIADVNAALNGTVYRGLSNFYGADTLSVVTDDNGNTGAGGAKQASDTLGITVRAVNDPPSNTVPATTQVLDEDTPIVFTVGGGNGISVADPDDASLTVTLSSAQGVLTLSQTAGLTFLQGDGTRDGILQFSGIVADINAALEGLRFDPNADVNGSAQIALTTRDAQGATASSSIALSITPVADIAPDSVATDEDTAITFNALTGTNGASADNFESPAAYVSSVTQGAHGSVSFQADGTMTYTPAADFNGTDSFTYTVTSGGTTETATVTVTVRPVNDAPVLDLSASAAGTGYAASYGEGDPGVAIVAADVSVSDVDSATMASAKLVITNGSTGDTLAIAGSLPAGITANFDAGTYTLTLTGSATKADYQAFLQQVRFSSDSHSPSTVTRSIAVTVNDGALDSNAAVATVAFGDVNDAPVNGMPADQSLNEDTPLIFSAANHNAITITDPDAGNGSLTTTLSVGHGTLTLGSTAGVLVTNDGTGSVTLTGTFTAINAALDGTTYRPAADYNGADILTVVTNDNGNTGAGGAKTDTDTLALTILPVNDAPRAGTLPALGSLDGALVSGLDLGRYFSDVEGDVMSFSGAGLPPGLTVDPATGRVGGTIDHSASQGGNHGDYTVTITADDGHGGLTSRAFTWRVVNPAPIARDDGAITDSASPSTGSVFADNGNGPDSDPDGDPLSVAAVNGVAVDVGRRVAGSAGGRFTILADGSYRFDPGSDFADLAAGQTRTTQIGYTLSDGEGGISQAILFVTVTGRGLTPPVLAPTDATARDGETVSLPLAPLFPHPDDTPLTYGATGLPPGLAIDPATGIVSGTIDHAASGAGGLTDYRITVTATDPQGVTETRDVIYRITNPAPTARDDVATTAESTPVAIDVLANDISSDGDLLAIIASGDAAPRAGHGQVSVVNGQLVYTPDAHFNGRDTITYSIGDGNGGVSTATVIVTVTPVNDAPEAGTLPDLYGRDGDAVRYDVSSRFHDPDTDPSVVQAPSGDHLSFSATGLPPGLAIDPGTGVISGTLPNDAAPVSHYTVTVTATDDAGASVSRSFTWTVSDDAPKPAPDVTSTPAGSPVIVPVTANDVDPSGTAVRLVDQPGAASAGHGTVSVDAATGLLTYTPDTGFSGRDTIVYTVENANGDRATGILTVTVTAVNQRPTAPDTLASRNGVDGQSVNVPLGTLITDPDGDPLTYAAGGLPPGLRIDPATGAITGTIDHAASGPSGSRTYVVTLTATDPSGLAVSRGLAWTVTNPAPTAADDAITTAEDTPVDIDVTANDHDPDGDPLSVVPGSAVAAHGTVTINPDGTLHYVPGRDFNGSDRILYTITDGNGGFATASVTVTVTPVNDAPVVDPASAAIADRSANDAQTISIPAGSAFRDVDRGDRLTFTATGLPPGLSLDPVTGLISGTLASDASTRVPGGIYTITLTGTDLAGASATTRFAVTVANPVPIAVDDLLTTLEDTPLTGNVLANDHDPDGDALHVEPVTGPAHGRLDLHPDGTFTYTPDADFHGVDSFTYALVDSDGGRATATVHLTVGAVNDAPVASADPLTLPANTVGTGRILASDRDGDPLSFRVTGGPANGTLTLAADGSYAYRPYAGYSGSDRFTVEVSDGHGGVALVAVAIDVTPNPIQVPPTVPMPGLVPLFAAGERPAAPPVQPPASSLAADGIILPAVAGIESLHSIGDVVLADGAVVAAVNGVAHLNGTVILPDHPVMLEEGQRIARMAWERFERMPIDDTTWFSPRPYLGRSLGVSLAAEEFGFGTSDLMVEAIRRPDTLSINLHGYAARLDSVAEVRLLGLDGAPPPDWIEGDGLGGFWGRPPAGTGIVRIELEIVLQDGRIVRRALSVDAETGEIRALPKPAPASGPKPMGKPAAEPVRPAEVPLFSTQLAALDTRAARDMALIERALTRLG